MQGEGSWGALPNAEPRAKANRGSPSGRLGVGEAASFSFGLDSIRLSGAEEVETTHTSLLASVLSLLHLGCGEG